MATFAAVTHHGRGKSDGETAAHVATSAPKRPADILRGRRRRPVIRTTGVTSLSTSSPNFAA